MTVKALMPVRIVNLVAPLAHKATDMHATDTAASARARSGAAATLIGPGLRGGGVESAMVQRAGIELPLMYRLGYDNANCIGCVKGGEGYWRAIREDFPAEFEELATVQDELGEGAHLFRNRATGERYSLRDLGAGPVRRNEKLPACSFFCELAEQEYAA